MQVRVNDRLIPIEPHRIMDVPELKRRLADGALLYWTMVRPAHAIVLDPRRQTACQLAFFRPLWGLQRSKQIRHDRYDGIYQVFLPTTPALERTRDQQRAPAPVESPIAKPVFVDIEALHFEPSL